jgi:enamine deaminase RidA (YjgF/YER057c/UK114 family)
VEIAATLRKHDCYGRNMTVGKDMDMANKAASISKEAFYFGVPAEDEYGYAQAIKVGDTIYISGQLANDGDGNLIAPAPLDGTGCPTDFSAMADQMRVTYANAAKVLAHFGATLDHVVEETLYVLDVDAAFAVAGKVRKEAYNTAQPQCASNLIGVPRLAFPEQIIEIAFRAVLPPAA